VGNSCGSLVGLLLVNEMLRHFLLHHLGNLARLLEMRLGLSIQTDTKIETERLQKEGQIEILRGTCFKNCGIRCHLGSDPSAVLLCSSCLFTKRLANQFCSVHKQQNNGILNVTS